MDQPRVRAAARRCGGARACARTRTRSVRALSDALLEQLPPAARMVCEMIVLAIASTITRRLSAAQVARASRAQLVSHIIHPCAVAAHRRPTRATLVRPRNGTMCARARAHRAAPQRRVITCARAHVIIPSAPRAVAGCRPATFSLRLRHAHPRACSSAPQRTCTEHSGMQQHRGVGTG